MTATISIGRHQRTGRSAGERIFDPCTERILCVDDARRHDHRSSPGCLGDACGRRFTYQVNLLIFGLPRSRAWTDYLYFVMGLGLGAETVVGLYTRIVSHRVATASQWHLHHAWARRDDRLFIVLTLFSAYDVAEVTSFMIGLLIVLIAAI